MVILDSLLWDKLGSVLIVNAIAIETKNFGMREKGGRVATLGVRSSHFALFANLDRSKARFRLGNKLDLIGFVDGKSVTSFRIECRSPVSFFSSMTFPEATHEWQ